MTTTLYKLGAGRPTRTERVSLQRRIDGMLVKLAASSTHAIRFAYYAGQLLHTSIFLWFQLRGEWIRRRAWPRWLRLANVIRNFTRLANAS